MAKFSFTVLDNEHKPSTGTLEAADREAALKVLVDRDLIVTRLEEVRARSGSIGKLLGLNRLNMNGEEILGFTQQLAAMLDAGVPVKKALETMTEDAQAPAIRQILSEIAAGLSSGSSLSEMMRNYPRVFSRMYISMIAAGEASGSLPTVMFRLSDYIEKSEHLRRKVTSALYYPSMVVSFAFIVMSCLVFFGIPFFKEIYAGFDSSLPPTTRFFIDFMGFISKYALVIMGVMVLGMLLVYRFMKTDQGRLAWDTVKLEIPIIGSLLRKLMIARFARTLSILNSAGISLLASMELVAGSANNRKLEKVIMEALKDWKEGETITEPLRRSKMFTAMAITMIASGEEAGGLNQMLEKLTSFYENQVEISLLALTGLIEPLVMIVVGIFIGALIVILGVPFLNISQMLSG